MSENESWEAGTQRCSEKKVLWKYATNLQENNLAEVQSSFIEINLWHPCSLENLLHIFRTPFLKNTSGGILLKAFLSDGTLTWKGFRYSTRFWPYLPPKLWQILHMRSLTWSLEIEEKNLNSILIVIWGLRRVASPKFENLNVGGNSIRPYRIQLPYDGFLFQSNVIP